MTKLLEKNDFFFQSEYIKSQAERILSMQDMNPASPSYGCFHLAYWRDKTSEFADARFQEAGALLGILALEQFGMEQLGFSPEKLLRHFSAALSFWESIQHSDGSFDEWYLNEHGFAATEFTLIAFGLAIHFLGAQAPEECRNRYKSVAHKAALWLSQRNDFVKYNHQMAAAAALAITADNLNDPKFRRAAKQKHDSVLKGQKEEGWFQEISGMDLGYCFVLLDYALLYLKFSGDQSGVPAMQKLMAFVDPFIQPDLTIMPEMGLCLNPYVGRLGILLLASHSDEARKRALEFNRFSNGYLGLIPYVSDDLRLCRWGYLPLVTWIYAQKWKASEFDEKRPLQTSFSYRHEANVLAARRTEYDVFFSGAGGGVVKVYFEVKPNEYFVIEDQGYLMEIGGMKYSSQGYNPSRKTKLIGETAVEIELQFGPSVFMFPGFISRLGLRVLCAIPGFPRYLRMGIDWYRQKKKTALNQSAAPVAEGKEFLNISRTLRLEDGSVVIEDHFRVLNSSILEKTTSFQSRFFVNGVSRDGADLNPKSFFSQNGWVISREFKIQNGEVVIHQNIAGS